MSCITKTFPGVRALDGVDLSVQAGEVHCLLGQNGAGKSTLIKVLAGAHQPDDGVITWRGERVTLGSPAATTRLGIATIYQELDLARALGQAKGIGGICESEIPTRVAVCSAVVDKAQHRPVPADGLQLTRTGWWDIPAGSAVPPLTDTDEESPL
jgi:ABC-type sugar transport system ATPase subunit